MPRAMTSTFGLLLLCVGTVACAVPSAAPPKGSEERSDIVVVTLRSRIQGGLSAPLSFDVPPGIGSLLIEVKGTSGLYFLSKFVTPSGNDLVESATYTTRHAREVPGLVDWLYPNVPDQRVEPGRYTILIRGESTSGGNVSEDIEVLVYATLEHPVPTCGLHLDFLVDEDALDSATLEADLAQVVARVDALYSQVGVHIFDYQIVPMVLGSSNFDLQSMSKTLASVDNILAEGRRLNRLRPGAMRLLLLRNIGENGPAGYSMGLPGPYATDRPNAAVLAATSAYSFGGTIDVNGFATTVGHEIGHYLGLYHTSERDGNFHDPIHDTPECDGPICTEEYDTNLMTSGTGSRRTAVSRGQGEVIRRHPLCIPFSPTDEAPRCTLSCTAPETCAVVQDTEQCLPACDPSAATPCTVGTCSLAENSVYICAP